MILAHFSPNLSTWTYLDLSNAFGYMKLNMHQEYLENRTVGRFTHPLPSYDRGGNPIRLYLHNTFENFNNLGLFDAFWHLKLTLHHEYLDYCTVGRFDPSSTKSG